MEGLKFEYGFESVNGIIKKVYHISEIPYIKNKCDVWNLLPLIYIRQFIGETDKNGVDIFVGDIVRIHKDDKYIGGGFYRTPKKIPVYRDYIVQYNKKRLRFEYKCLSKEPNYLETGTNKKKVIGSIHENK